MYNRILAFFCNIYQPFLIWSKQDFFTAGKIEKFARIDSLIQSTIALIVFNQLYLVRPLKQFGEARHD